MDLQASELVGLRGSRAWGGKVWDVFGHGLGFGGPKGSRQCHFACSVCNPTQPA